MSFKAITSRFSVSPQLTSEDVGRAAAQGFRSIICNRPDGEEPGQPSAAEIEAAAHARGLAFVGLPVEPGSLDDAAVRRMTESLRDLDGPVLAYCRTGTRSASLWALASASACDPDALIQDAAKGGYDLKPLRPRLAARAGEVSGAAASGKVYDVVVVGGGSAGLAAAASLLRRRPGLAIAVVEPSATHDYQPGWTMVGAGVFTAASTRRPTAAVMPDRVAWLRRSAVAFMPDSSELALDDDTVLRYRTLIVAPGLKLDWDAIPGLSAALGHNGVTSNYRYDLAPYTRRLVSGLKRGRALFTQPPMPIKCAGAPQKAMYLSCDAWRRERRLQDIGVEFHAAAPALFGVAEYLPALMHYIERYDIDLQLDSPLVEVDGASRTAVFERKDKSGAVERIDRPFDMLHVVPPQRPLDVVAQSPLAGDAGYVEVDPATLQHLRHPNVFSLGDACSAPNAKTAAAARKQAPVVAVNVLATLDGKALGAVYDGYGSCPLTVERGRIVLAEFGYGGKLMPTFPKWLIDGTRPSRLSWLLKAQVLPWIYWNGMLKGREWLAEPHLAPISFVGPRG